MERNGLITRETYEIGVPQKEYVPVVGKPQVASD
jgi:hypothetical protein